MKLLKMLKYDVKHGVINGLHKFLICFFITIPQLVAFKSFLDDGFAQEMLKTKGTLGDFLLYITRGDIIYVFDTESVFNVPVAWLSFQIGISYLIAYFAADDLDSFAKNVLIKAKSRSVWWVSKCLWCVLYIVAFYCVSATFILGYCIFKGIDLSVKPSAELMLKLYGQNAVNTKMWLFIFIAVGLPMLANIAIALVQLLLSLAINPVVSFATVCSLYIISAYYTNELLIGNFTMWQRSYYIVKQGVGSDIGFLLCLIIILITLLVGDIYINKKDLL